MEKEKLVKILLPALIFVSLVVTIIPELRFLALIFFVLGSITWFITLIGKFKLLSTDRDDNRYLKYFFYPATLFNLFLLFTSVDYRTSGTGIIYLIITTLTYLIYISFPNVVLGIPKDMKKGIYAGIGVVAGLFILNKLSPTFSLLTPQLPFSILGVFKGIIVIFIAPVTEAGLFRGALMGMMTSNFGLKFGTANTIQGGVFTAYHFLVYGIFLGTLGTLTELFGAVTAISGSLITAFTYALIVGYFCFKQKSLIPELVSHPSINAGVFFALLSVGQTLFVIG